MDRDAPSIILTYHMFEINICWLNQEPFRDEDGDEDAGAEHGEKKAKPFFSSAEGVSFRANSFMELNLSRPLLRACEILGYNKPTPIQVLCSSHFM